jgi:RNA polymerase sigma-70 factor (ECF subfamily)
MVSPLNLDLIAGFQRGTYESVKELYDLFYNDLAAFAGKAIQKQAAAHDMVLDTYLKLFSKRLEFDSLANIKAFLYITVKNRCQRYNTASPLFVEPAPWYEADAGRFNDEAVRARAVAQLCEEVGQLPEKSRRFFQLVFCKRLGMAEVAAQMELDQPAVVQQRTRVIQQLRDGLYKKDLFSIPLFIYFLAVGCEEYC